MTERICDMPECGKPHRARGLCAPHYNQQHQADRHAPRPVPCSVCGLQVYKASPGVKRRPVCSLRCRYRLRNGRWPEDGKALVGPIVRIDAPPKPKAPSRRRLLFTSGCCKWCADWFVQDMRTTGVAARFCSTRCNRAWHRRDWKARTNRIVPAATRALVYAREVGLCQLCFSPVDMALPSWHSFGPTLDHIECQSWTLVPDHSAANLRLTHRMCNSVRGNRL